MYASLAIDLACTGVTTVCHGGGDGLDAPQRPGRAEQQRPVAPAWQIGRVAVEFMNPLGQAVDNPLPAGLGAIRLGAGERPRLRFDPAVVRERWARVNAPPPEARTRRRRPTTKLHVVPTQSFWNSTADHSHCPTCAS